MTETKRTPTPPFAHTEFASDRVRNPQIARIVVRHTREHMAVKHGLPAVIEAYTDEGVIALYLSTAQVIELDRQLGLVATGVMRSAAEAEGRCAQCYEDLLRNDPHAAGCPALLVDGKTEEF